MNGSAASAPLVDHTTGDLTLNRPVQGSNPSSRPGLDLELFVSTSEVVPGTLLRIDGVGHLVVRIDPYEGPLDVRGIAVCTDGHRVSLTTIGRIWTVRRETST